MHYHQRAFIIILYILSGITVSGAITPEYSKMLLDSLTSRLTQLNNVNDSLAILLDIQDLSSRREFDSIGRQIVDISIRAQNSTVGLGALRNLASHNIRNDSLLNLDYNKALQFPDSEDRRETLAYISMMQNMHSLRYSTPQAREEQLRKLLREANVNTDNDIYQNIVLLHAICLYIAENSHGEMLSNYLDRLGKFVEQLRPEAIRLRNNYYTLAAMAYGENEEYEKAIEADRKLLKNIDAMEAGKIANKRRYRSFARDRYIALTRLLSNYEHLSIDSVEMFYQQTMNAVAEDTATAGANSQSLRPQIYYAMANKQYAKALNILQKAVDYPDNNSCRRQLLKMMITAASAIGDKNALIKASLAYNDALEKDFSDRTNQNYRELQIAYDVNQMRFDYSREVEELHRQIKLTSIIGGLIILILLIAVIWLSIRLVKLRKSFNTTSLALKKEHENFTQAQSDLLDAREDAMTANRIKAEFLQNLSNEIAGPIHIIDEYTNLILDCSEADDKPYLRHFADMVTLNADILNSTISDMLALALIDTNKFDLNLKHVALRPLCEAAIESIGYRLSPGVVANVASDVPNITINTDANRLMQILMQLLSNAAKFTQEGEITIDYSVDKSVNEVIIRITDTGIGINPECAEYIFQRFVKLNKSIQGSGIGLSIARNIADLLGGSLAVNTEYSLGAQLVLTLPID